MKPRKETSRRLFGFEKTVERNCINSRSGVARFLISASRVKRPRFAGSLLSVEASLVPASKQPASQPASQPANQASQPSASPLIRQPASYSERARQPASHQPASLPAKNFPSVSNVDESLRVTRVINGSNLFCDRVLQAQLLHQGFVGSRGRTGTKL